MSGNVESNRRRAMCASVAGQAIRSIATSDAALEGAYAGLNARRLRLAGTTIAVG